MHKFNVFTSYHSDIGSKRSENQDAIFLRVCTSDHDVFGIAVVSDGVSALVNSAKASQYVVTQLDAMFEKIRLGFIEIENVLLEIHETLRKQSLTMGTTLSCIVFTAFTYRFFQVGDSRIYQLHKNVKQLTTDQTLAQYKLDHHKIDKLQFHNSHEHHILTQCFGYSAHLQMVQGTGTYANKDVFLLCSDGVYHCLSKDVLKHYMKLFQVHKKKDLATDLVKRAIALGEQDNSSAVMFMVETQCGTY